MGPLPGASCALLLLCFTSLAQGAGDGSHAPMVVRLARRMRERRKPEHRDDPFIVAETNSRFHPMTCWFLDVLDDLNVERPILVALDSAEYTRLKKLKVPVARYEGLEMNYTQTWFRTYQYNRVVNYKWRILLDLLKHGFDVLVTDVDIHWKRNPLPYLKSLPRCDLYLTTNAPGLPRYPNGTIRPFPPFPGSNGVENDINTGFYWARSNPRVIALVETILTKLNDHMDDQFHFNKLFNSMYIENKAVSQLNHTEGTCANYGSLTFHILRVDLFPLRIHHQRFNLRDDHYILHYNWIVDYTEKWDTMIKAGSVHRGYRYISPE